MPSDGRRWFDRAWLLTCVAASSLWCLTAAQRLGATFDEPVYVARGLEGWRTGSHAGLLRLGTMPLPADVQTLPLYLAEWWRGVPWDPAADLGSLLPWARVANLLFWTLLLIYGWRIGHSLAGPWGGRLATAVLACEPNLLAHAALATTDIALTACLLAFLHHFRAGRGAVSPWRRVVVPGIWYGVALTSKASALVFGPLCALAIESERLLLRPSEGEWESSSAAWSRFLHDSVRIGLLGVGLAFLLCGCDWWPEPSFVAWAHNLPDGAAKPALVWIAEHLRIFSNAGEGIVRQIKHNMHGHGTFLLGQSRDGAFWYYFPVLLTIKLTPPFLFAPFVLTVSWGRSLCNWALASAAALLVFSLTCRVQIGIRLLLPCVALAGIGLAAAAVHTFHAARSIRARTAARLLAGACAVWMAAASVAAWPDGLRYINVLWGGRRDGYRIVSDSNYDWGQGLPELARWQQRHGVGDLSVWYFGTDPAIDTLPVQNLPLHALPVADAADLRGRVAGRHLAVGTTILYGYGLTDSHRRAAAILRSCSPVARTGTFLIFDFTRETPAGAQVSQARPAAAREAGH